MPATSAPASPPPASVTASPPIGTPMPAPTASARVAGRVEDPEGRGLAWALVYLRPEVDTGDRFLLTDTALDGSFELVLPAGRYRLVVEHEGFEPAWYGGSEPGVLELTPSESVVGLILRLAPANGPPGPAAGGGSPIAPPPGDIGIRPPEPSNPEPEAARPSREPKEGMA
ncbi:MAG: carboxypeptidase regulatory-like domain-containing protein [Chloroflexi bacterium]|nr:carboxypeptidase regulatory-like domain-containing protein [Chloroflexota bacterium]